MRKSSNWGPGARPWVACGELPWPGPLSPGVRARGTDGGVVTSLLLHLLDTGRIDGAIVTKRVGPFQRQPWLALSKEEILEAAGFHFDTSHGMKLFSDLYSTYSPSISQLGRVTKRHLHRVAFVGTPCQINAIRRMEALGIVPSASIKFHFGLFCTGNFYFGPEQRRVLEEIGNFTWEEVRKINVKEELMVHLHNQEVRYISLDKLDFMKRYACQYCDDYSAEYADLSFGGIGAPDGWTTVITPHLPGEFDSGRCQRDCHRTIQLPGQSPIGLSSYGQGGGMVRQEKAPSLFETPGTGSKGARVTEWKEAQP